jgi:hypothetical protein
MGKFIRLFYLSFLFLLIPANILSAGIRYINFKGDYFIYGEDQAYLYGGGNIIIKIGEKQIIKGNTLYLDIALLKGVLMGKTSLSDGKEKKEYDEIRFTLYPFKFEGINYGKKISEEKGKSEISIIKLLSLKTLKQSAVFYEMKEFKLYKSKKITGKYVIPYIMGLPSFPMKKLTVKKTEIIDRTMFFVKNINYSQSYGLSLISGLKIKSKNIKGDYEFRLFERGFFKLLGEKRGLNISGETGILIKGKKLLNISSFLSSDYGSFSFNLYHENNIGFIFYSFNQSISGMKGEKTYSRLSGKIVFKKYKTVIPKFDFQYNYNNSFSYRISTYLKLLKHFDLNLSYNRKKNNEEYVSDSSGFSSSLNFSSKILSFSSNINLNKDFMNDTLKKDFSLNFKLPSFSFFHNIDFNLSPFFSFSEFPSNDNVFTKNSFGLNFSIISLGIELPLGITLSPSVNLYQLWEKTERGKTNFNYVFSLEKKVWHFNLGIDYNLSSSYFSDNFWVEGYNLKNLNFKIELENEDIYTFISRFYFNNDYKLENISFRGLIKFPFKIKLSSYAIYNNYNRKMQTFEIFLEKNFRNRFRLQGGYSLLLKRFFIKVIPS